ncbi:hypothetical protein [Bacteroides sp.]|uniref:hypothetical protein n=1 Tax=Bacteroides sp. TaxID=29523 RepID=UPI002589F21E|nr:hypothetical protein [Bacteroides sp.]
MNRQRRRTAERKEQKARTKTYNLTETQLQVYVRQAIERELKNSHEEAMNESTNTAMILLLTLPLEVLMDHYWPKSYAKKIPEFTSYVLEYYERWQNGELDMDELKEDLWTYGGVRLEVEE